MAKNRSLADRYKQSYDTRDKAGGQLPAFDWKEADNPKFFKLEKDKKYRINIIPYEVSSKNHPLVRTGRMKTGVVDYQMDIWLHRYIGASKSDIVCLKRNYGKPCPICEQAKRYYDDSKEKEYQALKPSRRVLYNIIDSADRDAGIQVFETSYALFEKELIEAAQAEGAESGTILDFADIENGSEIQFRTNEETLGKNKFLEFKGFSFASRKVELEDSLIDEAIQFDRIMKVLSYEEIEALLYGEEEEEIEEDDEDEKPTPKKKSTRPQEEEQKDEEEEEKPAPKKKPVKEVEDEDDEDEKPAPKKKASSQKCPHGHTFATDCDEYEECDECELWAACVKAQKAEKAGK